MIFFGHRFIESEKFYHISGIDSILRTPPSSILFIEFSEKNIETINHAVINSMSIAVSVKNITEILYASALGASYVVVQEELAKTAQDLADSYLFDAKILVMVEDEEDIEELALLGADGVIFAEAIVKVN
ncbi:hypothetical protein [Sulfurimonas sp.]|uniref:hypothetical protein n=1 Tax=Sulfurimonas sp. TaxID=2022749 RepID=UPI0025E39164|nr:hypothetical protein [Sulfurimonas sp.]MDD5158036.1 hypothetical protein [Sulfurimonas sp.]